ncbi:MAG: ATP/GTP-binding protein [Sandaracinaceae bacterium]
MTVVNPLAREISAKIVFYGPGLSGKTTTLKYIHSAVKPQRRGELVTLATEGDRTIFFDFLPLHVKEVQGMGVRFQLYTVPGQVFYEATRKLVLSGADGVVFVADSQKRMRDANLASLDDLYRNLRAHDLDPNTFPLVFQFNKRDLPEIMSVPEMHAALNHRGVAEFETQATTGGGVLDSLRQISRSVISSLWERFPKPTETRVTVPPLNDGIEAELARVSLKLGGGGFIALAPEEEAPQPEPAPDGALSFAPLWEGADAAGVAAVENAARDGAYGRALTLAVQAMVELLDSLPGTGGQASPMAKAALLGLDGREFLRFCRLAGLHAGSATQKDALFALYMLVSARLKASTV